MRRLRLAPAPSRARRLPGARPRASSVGPGRAACRRARSAPRRSERPAVRGFDEEECARRATRWLEWVGLEQLAERPAGRLSGGEQRRVALARALAPSPRVLVADEPTAHLDRSSGRVLIRLLAQAAHEGGTTVVAASHDPDVVSAADSRLQLGVQN
jgi:ABC-type lipoprotein export system ATPase subunit